MRVRREGRESMLKQGGASHPGVVLVRVQVQPVDEGHLHGRARHCCESRHEGSLQQADDGGEAGGKGEAWEVRRVKAGRRARARVGVGSSGGSLLLPLDTPPRHAHLGGGVKHGPLRRRRCGQQRV